MVVVLGGFGVGEGEGEDMRKYGMEREYGGKTPGAGRDESIACLGVLRPSIIDHRGST